MSEENLPKEERGQIQPLQPDINKGEDHERSGGYEKLHAPGTLHEGYQPIRDIATPPPDGGSGVPDKTDE